MSELVTLPAPLEPTSGLEEMREYLQGLDAWLRAREPTAAGGTLEKFLTAEAAVNAGLLTYSPGLGGASGAAGTSGNTLRPGNATLDPSDPSQPTPASGLVVTSITSGFFIEISPPTYRQGGGNGRTIIYRANWTSPDPLPTFADAVEVGTMSGRSTILVLDAEPGVQAHFWAKSETRHPTLQASPTGGTNGVSAVAGLVSDDHIASLSVSKLIAGTLQVGEYIESTGYDPGVEGFRLNGDGTGQLAGLTIGADYIQSYNYVPATSGWHINNDGTAEFDAAVIRGTLTTNQIQVGAASKSIEDSVTSQALSIHADGYAYLAATTIGTVTRDLSASGFVVFVNGVVWLEADATLTDGEYQIHVALDILVNSNGPGWSVVTPRHMVRAGDILEIPFSFNFRMDSAWAPAGTHNIDIRVTSAGYKTGASWIDPGVTTATITSYIEIVELKV